MNLREVSRFLSNYIFILASFMIVPFLIACYYQLFVPVSQHPQPHSTFAFLFTILICLAVGYLLYYYGKKSDGGNFFRKEGFLAVILIWFISGVIGALPFYFSKTLDNPVDAYYEAISGFTTTGSTVMYPMNYNVQSGINEPITLMHTDRIGSKYTFYGNIKPVVDAATGQVLYSGYDAIGRALLFWRSFMQWVGGMGIVVLFIAILPAYGLGGNKLLMQQELAGPSIENIAPRARDAASLLWKVYLLFTLLGFLIIKFSNNSMDWYDSLLISMAAISTGGFLPLKESILIYNLPVIQWIMIFLMFIGSTNFTLHFYLLRGKLSRLMDTELLLFVISILIGSFLVLLCLIGTNQFLFSGQTVQIGALNAIQYSLFQYISSQSTTGIALMDFNQWPFLAQAILISATYIGGMSCSTAGGIKVIRHYILLKTSLYRTEAIFKPDQMRTFKIRNTVVNDQTKETVQTFFFIMICFSLISTLIYIADGLDFKTAFGTTSSMLNNVGFGYGVAGTTQSFAFMSNFSKLISTFWMILGRLEFFVLLILFTPAFWKKS
jgi:trk system potassium uptake protein TrkH